jgi:hypothetical protein
MSYSKITTQPFIPHTLYELVLKNASQSTKKTAENYLYLRFFPRTSLKKEVGNS